MGPNQISIFDSAAEFAHCVSTRHRTHINSLFGAKSPQNHLSVIHFTCVKSTKHMVLNLRGGICMNVVTLRTTQKHCGCSAKCRIIIISVDLDCVLRSGNQVLDMYMV